MKHGIAAIPDDGIGKEVVREGRRVLDAAVQFAAAPTRPCSSARAASRAGRGGCGARGARGGV
jgi:isocitrate/isopropylmalate dehydrogenase